jgi:hypothetical protein
MFIIADTEQVWQGRGLKSLPFAQRRSICHDVGMAKRNLRIIKRVRKIPVLGVCELCEAQFPFEPHPHSQPSEAQAAIQQQFNAHQCKLDTSHSVQPVTN